jgi:hypothetical protein
MNTTSVSLEIELNLITFLLAAYSGPASE